MDENIGPQIESDPKLSSQETVVAEIVVVAQKITGIF